ncbi:MAG: hydrolase [Actinomycetospora sp.]|nr:hydrolase [Actinomycetospora sp.]
MTQDTPRSDHLWVVHSRHTAYAGRTLRVEMEDVTAPAGDRFAFDRAIFSRVAVALVLDAQDRVLVLRTHRHVIDREGWELPGGIVEPGEDPSVAASREAAEETGWRPDGPGRTLVAFEPLPGSAEAPMSVHVWTGAAPGELPLDPHEPGHATWIPFAEAVRLALAGEMLGAGSLVGVLALQAERTT